MATTVGLQASSEEGFEWIGRLGMNPLTYVDPSNLGALPTLEPFGDSSLGIGATVGEGWFARGGFWPDCLRISSKRAMRCFKEIVYALEGRLISCKPSAPKVD